MFSKLILLITVSSILLTKQNLVESYETIEKVYYDLDLSEALFQNYITKYKKQYTNEEFEYRFQVFQDTLRQINRLNQNQNSTLFGLNHFSDLTFEEFMASRTCVFDTTGIEQAEVPDIKPPAELDYRTQNLVTEVKNQGNCGSCYIFGAMGDVEGQHAKKHKELISLSEQYPLDCNSVFTCDGGDPEDVADWLSKNGGAVSTKDYPYVAEKNACKNGTKAVVKVKGARKTALRTVEQIKIMLAVHGPLTIALTVTSDFEYYERGVLREKCYDVLLNHAVLLVGYKEDYWIIKNSWSKNWGEDGYIRMAMDNNCGIGYFLCPSEVY